MDGEMLVQTALSALVDGGDGILRMRPEIQREIEEGLREGARKLPGPEWLDGFFHLVFVLDEDGYSAAAQDLLDCLRAVPEAQKAIDRPRPLEEQPEDDGRFAAFSGDVEDKNVSYLDAVDDPSVKKLSNLIDPLALSARPRVGQRGRGRERRRSSEAKLTPQRL